MRQENDKNLSRRNFLKKAGVGTATVAACATAVGAVCNKLSNSQTEGPFPPVEAYDLARGEPNPGAKIKFSDRDADLTIVEGRSGVAAGQAMILHGKIQDQNCEPVSNATVHMWQADNKGYYNHINDTSAPNIGELDPNFQYSTILRTDENGEFSLKSIVPKYYRIGTDRQGNAMLRTAHLHFLIRKMGYEPLTTQSYFSGDVLEEGETIHELNQKDILLSDGKKVLNRFKDLIAHFTMNAVTGIPEGNITLTVRKM